MATNANSIMVGKAQTTNALNLLSIPIILALIAIATLGLHRGWEFVTWAYIVSVGAYLGGAVVGLLFGLPGTSGGEARRDDKVRYVENTSLEQIADWLTKIIVGVTLVQIDTLSASFSNFSLSLTKDLLCPAGPATCGRTAGGALVATFSIGGFLMAYLWMRRFFITELLIRDEEIADLRARQQAAAREGRVQRGRGSVMAAIGIAKAAPPVDQTIAAILTSGVTLAPPRARSAATAIAAGNAADDPWLGAFGGSSVNAHAVLTANVSQVVGQANNFEIEIVVAGLTPQSQNVLSGGQALFYLHPTFGRVVKVATFGPDGRACLTLFGYGAFTVGVLLPDGSPLELDLSTLAGAPAAFRIA